ncbi:uncharacterized protein LOC123547184 isoform X2 [Mercenaria mercenaria]|uniref:uncharacterized protein LOC123547184 isoform X2 n=1 Tax=Mercenaria mercenaria TaxID=6596 RepID=UPI00234F020E|nr:uncharacterized protein LOC123547184 isoform X2 [Mercenaria mercenaria]
MMDVTYGLLSNLVKTRSIQRVLSPIASQISLLIILNESEDGTQMLQGEMVPCAKAVMQASHKLVTVAKQHAHTSTDQEFKAQTVGACEVLELSSSNLYIASERLEASNSSREARNKLVQASKDVLQGTMKVLLVADDAEIRRLIMATHIVTEKLSSLNNCINMTELVQRFKEFTDALAVMTGISDKRQRDLIHSRQRERIITALNILKKSISSLSVAMQNSVKYSHNPQAQIGKSYIVNEIQSALGDIVDAVQNRDTDEEDIDLEQPGKFVSSIDMALEALGEEKRSDLHVDLEMWTEEAVRHSMTVAHLCYDSHRDLIIKTCQRVIQVKSRVIQVYKTVNSDRDETQARGDYDDVCELLTDEFCELEKNVNISLLHLVVEFFKETTEPLERLVKKAVYSDMDGVLDHSDACVVGFEDHAEKVCQIATLAAASSTDARRVHSIRTSVHRLEHLDPEIVPSVISISRSPQEKSVMRHLKLLMKEWTFELTNLIKVMDEMTDPKMFMLVSERKVEDDINTCNGCLLITDQAGFSVMLQAVIGRSRRVAQVAERIVDAHEDPLFRNGLMVFIQKLKKAITAVRTSGGNVSSEFTNKLHQNTLRRRFDLLQDSLTKVKAGLSDSNHPHVLSPLRRNVRGSEKLVKRLNQDPFLSALPHLSKLKHSTGDRIIATSVPKLNLASVVREDRISPHSAANQIIESERITPQSAALQKTEMGKSMSVSQITAVYPKTYAWRLATDLVSWSTKGDRDKVNLLCGDLLGWTNHIVDVSNIVLVHCTDLKKKKELESLCYCVDQSAPELLEKAKYVLHGDFSQLNGMKTQADDWATKVEQVRVYVDITVETWKTITDKVCDAARLHRADLVKHQLDIVQGHIVALNDLVSVAGKLRWENQVKGQDKIDSLCEDVNEVENLGVTFKTTAGMVAEQGLKDQNVELDQLGREWCVKVYKMTSDIESLCSELLDLGVQKKIWPTLHVQEGLVDTLQNENKKLKDLLKSACYGDDSKKELYKEFLADMVDCVEELKCTSLARKSGPGSTLARPRYTSLNIGLYRGFWILKAVQCVDLARQQTCMYSGSVDIIIEKAFILKAAAGSEREIHLQEFSFLLTQFTDIVATVRKRVLQGIQLSSELGKRSVVRQCLDSINTLLPEVVAVLKTLADVNSCSHHGDVLWHRLLWCARVYHLVTCLRQMTDVRAAIIDEIEKLLRPQDIVTDYDEICEKLSLEDSLGVARQQSNQIDSQNRTLFPGNGECAKQEITQVKKSLPGNLPRSPLSQNSNFGNIPRPTQQTSKKQGSKLNEGVHNHLNFTQYIPDQGPNIENFDPVVVDLKAVEEQILYNTSQALEQTSTQDSPTVKSVDRQTEMRRPNQMSVSALTPTPVIDRLLKDAQFIERQTEKWEDESNPIVKVAKTMATQIKQMTQYVKYEGPINNHLALVETAKALAENSDKVLHFAHILIKYCVDKRFCEDLQSYCLQVPTVRQQLLILSNVQLGTAKADTADRILVQNAHNLMKRILQTISACEAVCVKGLSPMVTEDSESSILLATRWRQKYVAHRQQGVLDGDTDELGLRIVEGDDLPPSLTQIFQT